MDHKYAFLFLLVFLIGCSASSKIKKAEKVHQGTEKYYLLALKPFYHGVASGDPNANGVTLWTRLTPENQNSPLMLDYELASDMNFVKIVYNGQVEALQENDYTVNPRVMGLESGMTYYFRFKFQNTYSSIGRTKTAPEGISSELRFAIVSCTNFEAGYFNALGRIAEMDDLDAVIHLGDYIYEYGQDYYGDKSLERKHLPNTEILKLNDYRTRYAQYRLDEDLQRVHQRHPFITIWDDHEISNNAYKEGAQNHDDDKEGLYSERRTVAQKAYYEWLPVQSNEKDNLYRTISYGDLVDWIMLDERLAGRSKQVESDTSRLYLDDQRSMLGNQQLNWFKDNLKNSKATWKLIGNQVIFSDRDFSNIGRNKSMDAWDGYPTEKKSILEFVEQEAISDLIFLTGDTHSSWAFEVPKNIAHYTNTGQVLGFEFGTPSVTSANANDGSSTDQEVIDREISLYEGNPHLKYVNMRDHGYIILTVRRTEVIAEWYYVDAINKRSIRQRRGEKIRVLRGGSHITK